jgi:prepilin-type N-terminal cleavage/methylation domain-containing protein
MNENIKTRGFTLIETVVYLALFGILMSGAVTAAFTIFESADRQQTHTLLQVEGSFIIAKINWAVGGAQSINQPSGFGSLLSVNKITRLNSSGQPVVSVVTFSLPTAPGDVIIQDGAAGPYPLNNSNVVVTRLGFLHTLAGGNGVLPESVTASTTLTARTASGALLSEDFSTIIYLHH